MEPFLRYLYCEPAQLREHAELRMGLLKILLQPRSPENKEAPSVLEHHILQLLCDLIPYFQVKVISCLALSSENTIVKAALLPYCLCVCVCVCANASLLLYSRKLYLVTSSEI